MQYALTLPRYHAVRAARERQIFQGQEPRATTGLSQGTPKLWNESSNSTQRHITVRMMKLDMVRTLNVRKKMGIMKTVKLRKKAGIMRV
jgi:hypothetical protein